MKLTYRTTMLACYNGYITQAICINLAPLLFLIFQRNYGLSLLQISLLITFNFSAQLISDFCASVFSDHMDLRRFTVLSHVLAVLGLFGLALLPEVMDPFLGLSLSTVFLGVGGGMTEVMISPIMEACPTDEKSGNMSFLHSFYCWGQVLVILLSGVFFYLFTAETHWHYFPMLLSLFPIVGVIAFSVVPIYQLPKAEKNPQKPTKKAVFQPVFWLFLVMMFCGGATENVMCQWASSFAESALGLSKSVGDLLGPCMFATMMGLSRILYGKLGKRFSLDHVMMVCCVLSVFFYLLAAFAPNPVFALIGCALCGLTVGIFWPGIISRGAARMPEAGVMMFASFALAGDLGCLIGASAAGAVADYFGGDLRWAFCFATLFPIINFVILSLSNMKKRTQNSKKGESET